MAQFGPGSNRIDLSDTYVRGYAIMSGSRNTTWGPTLEIYNPTDTDYIFHASVTSNYGITISNTGNSAEMKLRASTIYLASTSNYINSTGIVYSGGSEVLTTSTYRSDVAGFSRTAADNEDAHPTSAYYILHASSNAAVTTDKNGTSSTHTLAANYVQSSTLYLGNAQQVYNNPSSSMTNMTAVYNTIYSRGYTNDYGTYSDYVKLFQASSGIAYVNVWGWEIANTNGNNGGIIIASSASSYYSRDSRTNWSYILSKREGQWDYHGSQTLFANAFVPPNTSIYIYIMNLSYVRYNIVYLNYSISG